MKAKNKKYNKFETVYNNARQYALGCKAGSLIVDQRKFDKTCVDFQRFVYLTFRQEVQQLFKMDIDRSAWVFDQNELQTLHTGKKTNKQLCFEFYLENEAYYLASCAV